jgi:hypothetical protein
MYKIVLTFNKYIVYFSPSKELRGYTNGSTFFFLTQLMGQHKKPIFEFNSAFFIGEKKRIGIVVQDSITVQLTSTVLMLQNAKCKMQSILEFA